jgi:chromosome segregation ATPase
LYSQLATTTDSAIAALKEQIQEKKAELRKLQKKINEASSASEKLSDEISQKMRKLKIVTDAIKETGGENQLLRATASLFAMLQSPIETDEQIQAGLDSVIAIARISADVEQTKPSGTPTPAPRTPIESTLQALRDRITARQLREFES